MKYNFKLNICTDGDFGFPYVPRGMEYDGWENYSLEVSFDSKESAIDYIKKTIDFLKEHITTGRHDYVVENFKIMLDNFYNSLIQNPDKKYYSNYMGGNYDVTEIELKCDLNKFNITLYLNDEDYMLIRENGVFLSQGDLTKHILDKFKELKENNNGN